MEFDGLGVSAIVLCGMGGRQRGGGGPLRSRTSKPVWVHVEVFKVFSLGQSSAASRGADHRNFLAVCTWRRSSRFSPRTRSTSISLNRTSKPQSGVGLEAPFTDVNEALNEFHTFSTCSRCSHRKIWTSFQRAPCIWQVLAPVFMRTVNGGMWKNSTYFST